MSMIDTTHPGQYASVNSLDMYYEIRGESQKPSLPLSETGWPRYTVRGQGRGADQRSGRCAPSRRRGSGHGRGRPTL